MTTILHKRGKGIPTADKFSAVGEILIDTDTGIAYTLTDDGDVSAVGGDSVWSEAPVPNLEGYRWVTLKDQSVGDDEYGFRIQYCATEEDPDNPDPDFPNGPWDRAELRIRDINARKADISTVNASNLDAVDAKVVEQQVLGGIQILGADQERPEELPDKFSANGKSIQYALTVFHETLGRSVLIDKEGIIRANDFTDLDGNSIVGGEEFNGTVVSPLIVDGTGNSDYNKARVTAKLKSSIEQEFNLTFESRQLQNYGEWYQRKAPSLYIEDEGADGINESTPTNLGSYDHPFGEGWFSGPVRAADYLDVDGNSIVSKQQVLTQSEYDALTPDPDTVYFIV